jgi:hypothetical protein
MLESLFGNKNIERILLFLFVNGRSYATQLHRLLRTSLTPIQKALLRLEKGGIIMSYLEGKTRIYQFSPSFPLHLELEQLLKKSYSLLPANEKKQYYLVRDEYAASSRLIENKGKVLHSFWDKLITVKRLVFHSKSKSQEEIGWNGKGQGEVVQTKQGQCLTFHEKGSWQNNQGELVSFSNVFRWTLDKDACVITLEHLRRGPENPIFLFDMAPSGAKSLSSVDSHLCAEDVYFGQIQFDQNGLRFHWRVIGPKKNEEISYFYS